MDTTEERIAKGLLDLIATKDQEHYATKKDYTPFTISYGIYDVTYTGDYTLNMENAAYHGDFDIVKYIFLHKDILCKYFNQNVICTHYCTRYAAMHGNIEIIEMLHDPKINHLVDAMTYACYYNKLDVVKWISHHVDYGSNEDIDTYFFLADSMNIALEKNHLDIYNYLHEKYKDQLVEKE